MRGTPRHLAEIAFIEMRSSQNSVLCGNDSTCRWKVLRWNWMLYSCFKNVLLIPKNDCKETEGTFINPVTIVNQHSSVHLNNPPIDYKPSCALLRRPNVHPQMHSPLLLQKSIVQNNEFHYDNVISVLYHTGIIPPVVLSYPPFPFWSPLSPFNFDASFFQNQIPHMMNDSVFIFMVYLISLNMMILSFISFVCGRDNVILSFCVDESHSAVYIHFLYSFILMSTQAEATA